MSSHQDARANNGENGDQAKGNNNPDILDKEHYMHNKNNSRKNGTGDKKKMKVIVENFIQDISESDKIIYKV